MILQHGQIELVLLAHGRLGVMQLVLLVRLVFWPDPRLFAMDRVTELVPEVACDRVAEEELRCALAWLARGQCAPLAHHGLVPQAREFAGVHVFGHLSESVHEILAVAARGLAGVMARKVSLLGDVARAGRPAWLPTGVSSERW